MEEIRPATKIELLKGVSLFSTLKERELAVIAQNSEFYTFNKDEVIFHAGSYSSGLYVINEGAVLITKLRDDNETVTIARFIRGEAFGELDLLEEGLMNATARAETDATLLMFPSRGMRFQEILSRHSTISSQILHELLAIIMGRIRSTNRLVSEKSQWVEDLRKQLFYDKLTGMYNRTFLEEEFPAQLRESGPVTSIIMVKPDNFKIINDTCGHETGDKALRYMAYCIKSQLRESDIPVRYRGDEFALIFPGTDMAKSINFAEHVRLLFSKLKFGHLTGDMHVVITVSIGVAVFPDHASDMKELVRACFHKMFEARERGGNQILCAGS
jgi:diguanylate cyclase (GGDEF)-like protein